MNLLQYSFTLVPSYRMDAIRERVAAKRHLLDGLPGLRWKAWMLSEPLPGRSQPLTYAPVYLFDDANAVVAFLRGDIYKGVTDAFGWTMPMHGPAMGDATVALGEARSCSVHTTPLFDHAALRSATEGPAPPADALLVARQLDISRMQLRSFTFRAAAPSQVDDPDAELVYEVMGVTSPVRAGS